MDTERFSADAVGVGVNEDFVEGRDMWGTS